MQLKYTNEGKLDKDNNINYEVELEKDNDSNDGLVRVKLDKDKSDHITLNFKDKVKNYKNSWNYVADDTVKYAEQYIAAFFYRCLQEVKEI